jgi:hypothetical protein
VWHSTVDTNGKLAAAAIAVGNVPQVSTTPVVNENLREDVITGVVDTGCAP